MNAQMPRDRFPKPSALLVVALVLLALFLVFKAAFAALSLLFTVAVLFGVYLLLRSTLRRRRP